MAAFESGDFPSLSAMLSEDFLCCHICMEPYASPKMLPCLHTYCCKCLEGYVETKHAVETFPCPTCQSQIVLPPSGVDGLKNNFFLTNLQEAVTRMSLKDTSPKGTHFCDNCDDSTTHACEWCHECETYLCSDCKSAHSRMKATKLHTTITVEEALKNPTKNAAPKKIPTYCEKHPAEEIKLYCLQCDQPLCITCKITIHDGHRSTEVSNAAEQQRDVIGKLCNVVQRKKDLANDALDAIIQYKADLDTTREEETAVILNQRDQLVNSLNLYCNAMVGDLDKVIEAEKKQVDAIQGDIECTVASITGSTEVVDALMHHGSDTEFVCMKRDLEQQLIALSNQPLVQLTEKLNVKFSQSMQDISSLFGALQKTHVSIANPAPQPHLDLRLTRLQTSALGRFLTVQRPGTMGSEVPAFGYGSYGIINDTQGHPFLEKKIKVQKKGKISNSQTGGAGSWRHFSEIARQSYIDPDVGDEIEYDHWNDMYD